MKICHFISSMQRGGIERQIATIYKYSSTKYPTKIVCLQKKSESYIEEYKMENDVIYLNTTTFLGRLRELCNILQSNNIDILWAWGGYEATLGLLISLITPIKFINSSVQHGIVRFMKKKQLWRCLILHLSKNIVANSRAGLKANLLKRGTILYNGLDEQFRSSEENTNTDELNKDSQIITFISVANLVPYKDYISVLYALSSMKEDGYPFSYLIVGEGPERDNIENTINKLNLYKEVKLLGRRSDIPMLLAKANVLIHSSRGEGVSNAIIEAMSASLPIVASNVGGTPEVVTPDCGFLFEYKNITQLYMQLVMLHNDIELCKKMGRSAKKRAESIFSVTQMIDTYNNINNHVLNESNKKNV